MRYWEILEGREPREFGERNEHPMYGERDSEAKRAYEMGYEEGCKEGWRKAMTELGERRSYGERAYGERGYEMGERRDSRGRYM